MTDAGTLCNSQLLCATGAANRGVQEPVAHGSGKGRPVVTGDQQMHQIHRGRSTAAGDAVAVDDVERTRQRQVRVPLGEIRRVLPMNGQAPTLHQTGPRETQRPSSDAPQRPPPTGPPPPPGEATRTADTTENHPP